MAAKRKATDDAPESAQPPPQWRRRNDGDDEDNSSMSDCSRESLKVYQGDDEHSSLGGYSVGNRDYSEESEAGRTPSNTSVDSGEESEAGRAPSNMMLELNLHDPAESSDLEEPAAAKAQTHSPPATDQPVEMEVQPPKPTDQSVSAAEVADRSIEAAAPAPAVLSLWCLGCGLESALVNLVPVEHACLCLPCRSSPSRSSRCDYCDGSRR